MWTRQGWLRGGFEGSLTMNNGRMFSKLATSRSLSQIIILMKMEMRMWTKKMVLANKMHFLVFPVLVFLFSWALFGIEFDDNVDEDEEGV